MPNKAKVSAPQVANDAIEERKAAVESLIRAFNIAWVRLLAGYDYPNECMTKDLAERIKVAVEPFLSKGDRMLPKFDPYAQIRLFVSLEELVASKSEVRGEVELTSRSEWSRFDGTRLLIAPERITIQLSLSPELNLVTSAKFITQEA